MTPAQPFIYGRHPSGRPAPISTPGTCPHILVIAAGGLRRHPHAGGPSVEPGPGLLPRGRADTWTLRVSGPATLTEACGAGETAALISRLQDEMYSRLAAAAASGASHPPVILGINDYAALAGVLSPQHREALTALEDILALGRAARIDLVVGVPYPPVQSAPPAIPV
jgi:hypothetical protein